MARKFKVGEIAFDIDEYYPGYVDNGHNIINLDTEEKVLWANVLARAIQDITHKYKKSSTSGGKNQASAGLKEKRNAYRWLYSQSNQIGSVRWIATHISNRPDCLITLVRTFVSEYKKGIADC